jgi:hypothetical protein
MVQGDQEDLNEENVYLVLHEESPNSATATAEITDDLSVLVEQWVEQTQDPELLSQPFRTRSREYLDEMERESRTFRAADLRASTIICNNLEPAILAKVDRGASARKIWESLERMHRDVTVEDFAKVLAEIDSLGSPYITKSLAARTEMMAYARNDMRELGFHLPDIFYVAALLCGLDRWPYRRLWRMCVADVDRDRVASEFERSDDSVGLGRVRVRSSSGREM